jgi:hypothetical protein
MNAKRIPWLEWLVIMAVFFVVGGAPPPHVNEAHYLTKAKHYWDPSFCPGDLFLNSADPHLTFYWTFGWVTRLVSLPATAWIGRIVAWGLIAYAWQRLSRTITTTPWAAALSATIWVALIEVANFAGEWVVGGVEAKCFAYALVLLGLAALCRGSWKTTWVWFGAASAFHVLVGAWAVLVGLAVWLTEPRAARPKLKSILPGLIFGGLLSLPGLLPALLLERGVQPSTAAEAARIYVFERLPHHLAPLSLPVEEVQRRAMRFGVLSAAFILFAIGAFYSTNGRRRLAPPTAGDLTTVNQSAALRRIIRFALFALACDGVGLAIEVALNDQPLAAARVLRYYWFRQADIAVPLAASLALTALCITLLQRKWAPARALAVGPVIACGWFLMNLAMTRLENPRPPATARLERVDDWQDACAWIREQAPPDALFLIPRTGYSFKWYAARADVANYKDVPQDAESVIAWRRRCADVFPTVGIDGKPTLLSFPDQLGVKRLRELAQKYGATHVLARRYPPLDMKVVYPDKDQRTECYYTVYEIGEPPRAGKP